MNCFNCVKCIKINKFASRVRKYFHDIKPVSVCLSGFNVFVVLYSKYLRFKGVCFTCVLRSFVHTWNLILASVNTLRTGDAVLRFYITTVQDGWRKSAFLTRACFPCTVHLIMQYIEPVSECSCWRMFIETWPHSELTFRHRASSV